MVAATVGLGWLPPIVHLPDARAFEFSFYARHAGLVAIALGVARRRVHRSAPSGRCTICAGSGTRVTAGLRILRSPGRFARVVAAPQLVDWALRVGVAYAMLAAFGIPPALRYAVLVVVIDSVSTALPVTPGGVGAQQGLLVFALAGVATSGQVLAFSIGVQAVIVAFNIARRPGRDLRALRAHPDGHGAARGPRLARPGPERAHARRSLRAVRAPIGIRARCQLGVRRAERRRTASMVDG